MQLLTIEEVLRAGYSRDAAIQIVKIENERRRKSKMSTDNHVFTGSPSEYDNRDPEEIEEQEQESSEEEENQEEQEQESSETSEEENQEEQEQEKKVS